MAQGTLTKFDDTSFRVGSGQFNLLSDNFSLVLIDSIPLAADVDADLSDYTEVVTGGNYFAGGIALTHTWTKAVSGDLSESFFNANDVAWAGKSNSPTNIKAALLIDNTIVSGNALAFIDLTMNGVTAISLVSNNINITIDSLGLFKI